MSIERYNHFKDRYEKTKPIRGRQTDIRPLGDRRRDWEQVVKRETETGVWYGAHLYSTDCVMYSENGDVYVFSGSWASPITAQFIGIHTPWGISCYKRYSKLWLEFRNGSVYPIAEDKTFHIKYDKNTDSYYTDENKVVNQKVKDRSKTKEVRENISEFRNYARNMLKLADGWLYDDVVSKYMKWDGSSWGWSYYELGTKKISIREVSNQMNTETAKYIYHYMLNNHDEEHDVKVDRFLTLLCMIAEGVGYESKKIVRTEKRSRTYHDGTTHTYEEDIYDRKYKPEGIIRRIDYITNKANEEDIHTTRVVEVGDKPISNMQ